MNSPRSTTWSSLKLALTGVLLLGAVSSELSSAAGTLLPDLEDIVRIAQPRSKIRHATIARRSEAAETDASTCLDCSGVKRTRRAPAPRAEPKQTSESTSFDDQIAINAYRNAIKGRHKALFLGGAYVKGNKSKGMCAAAAKETLMDTGICKSYPQGNAYALEGLSSLVRNCGQRVSKLATLDPKKAPKNSIIIYSGHAGRRVHKFGHVENKITVTKALKRAFPKDRFIQSFELGAPLYCSDFCTAKPNHKRTNPVAAIYQLE